jgi:hypothetical protein
MAQAVEFLLYKHTAISSNPNPIKKPKNTLNIRI